MALVLVVDDEEVLLEMIAVLVEELGHESVIASSGCEALTLLHHQTAMPNLVITDIMMPAMSGLELAQHIRDDERLATVPIILISAGGKPPSTHPADHFLPKPFSIEQMVSLIEHCVR